MTPVQRARYVVTADRMAEAPWKRPHLCATAVMDYTAKMQDRLIDKLQELRAATAWRRVICWWWDYRDSRPRYRYRWP